MSRFFGDIAAIKYEGPESDNPLAFRHYDKDRVVLGKRMEDLLRFAVCFWHSFNWHGNDPFGGQTLMRPWFEAGDPLKKAELKLEVAFDFFATLGTPFFTFHDRDVAPEGADLAETNRHLLHIVDLMEKAMEKTGRRLLWGTANLFSHRRYMAGAATNPDTEVFAYAAAQVRQVMDITHRLNGANYVLWGGREGYESLLNTDLKREADQIGRFMSMVVEYKHKIGFKGTILIEPKPQEPTKHQYDYDSATVYAFLQKYGLANEIKLNIETNHATLAGHSFEHELAYAAANGILGSIDMNRGDPQNGWDTDQFPNNVSETALALYVIFKHGGFGTGGVNFDAKIRRQSIDPADLFHAHIGGMDVCARGLVIAASMIESGKLAKLVEQRYAGWNGDLGKRILAGKMDLAQLADHVLQRKLEPTPRSGQQERLENLVNSYI
jgi:xylose isomerase